MADVHRSLEHPPTIYAIRTMLHRLAKQGIVKARSSGKHSEMLYLPAILTEAVTRHLIKAFIERHFEGSAPAALQLLMQLDSLESPPLRRPERASQASSMSP